MKLRTLFTLGVVVLAALGAEAASFAVKGTVVQLRPMTRSVVVAHEDIPGFMPAMTMPFQVKDAAELDGLEPGALVEFSFVVGDAESFAEGFRVVGATELPSGSAKPSEAVKKVREGDRAPVARLLNQDGAATDLTDDAGRWTVMTFIFTRCPVPEFCPLMNRNFTAIQDALPANVAERTRLLSVTLDPEFDTSERLKTYGSAYGADFSRWEFATGSVSEIERLTEAFRVYVKENGVTLDHTLCTVLIAPDGEIEKVWRGNFWKPEEVVAALASAQGSGVLSVAASSK